MTRIMLETFVSKSILYVYQNAKWSFKKIATKIYPPKNTSSCPCNVFSLLKGNCSGIIIVVWR